MPSPLFSLSREVRDIIYAYLWSLTGITFVQHHHEFILEYSSKRGGVLVGKLPTWLLTNKLIFHEAIEDFFFHSRCTFISKTTNTKLPRSCRRDDSLCPPDCRASSPLKVFDLSKVRWIDDNRHRSLRLDISPSSTTLSKLHIAPSKRRISTPWYKDVRALLALLSAKPNALTEIRLDMILPAEISTPDTICWQHKDLYSRHDAPYDFDIDFSSLENIGTGMQRVHFSLYYPHLDRNDSSQVRACATAFPLIQHSLVRLAKRLTTYPKDPHPTWTVQEFLDEYLDGFEWHVKVTRGGECGEENQDLVYEGLLHWMDSQDNLRYSFERVEGKALTWKACIRDPDARKTLKYETVTLE